MRCRDLGVILEILPAMSPRHDKSLDVIRQILHLRDKPQCLGLRVRRVLLTQFLSRKTEIISVKDKSVVHDPDLRLSFSDYDALA